VRRAAWGLKEVIRLGRRFTVEDYVKTLEARAGLPASVAKGAFDTLERNRRYFVRQKPAGLVNAL
jgi:hypothetical protein